MFDVRHSSDTDRGWTSQHPPRVSKVSTFVLNFAAEMAPVASCRQSADTPATAIYAIKP